MKKIWSLSVVFFMLITVPVTLTANAEVGQVRGELVAELKPGDSETLKWQFTSDEDDVLLKLKPIGDISPFVSIPEEVNIENGVNTVEVVVSVPSDYSGANEISGKLMATPDAAGGGITGFLKSVTLSVEGEFDAGETVSSSETMSPAETDDSSETDDKEGGGCLIATAAYGTELAPQVQLLREIRDNTVMSTTAGMSFMTGFNQFYYSFSPAIADMERENPVFQEAVRALITPMVSTLSIMTLAEEGSEADVLGLGMSVIALNLGMYVAAPAAVGFAVSKRLRSRQ